MRILSVTAALLALLLPSIAVVVNKGAWYPQVLGLEEGSGTDKTAGEWARFFMLGTSRHFLRFIR